MNQSSLRQVASDASASYESGQQLQSDSVEHLILLSFFNMNEIRQPILIETQYKHRIPQQNYPFIRVRPLNIGIKAISFKDRKEKGFCAFRNGRKGPNLNII